MLMWANRPGQNHDELGGTTINSHGLRAREIEPKMPGKRRIVTTGDSSVYGVVCQDDEVFAAVLERSLGPTVEVFNGGVVGYSSAQSMRQLEPLWEPLAPDLVVIGNLWSDNNFDAFVDKEMMAYAGSRRFGMRNRLGTLVEHSALLDALFRLGNRRARQQIGWGMAGSNPTAGKRRVAIDDYVANLDAMVQRAHQAGSEVVFLMLANKEDIRAHERIWPWQIYRDAMRDAAARHGYPLVDVPRLFRASGLSPDRLFVDEMHPSTEGHRVIGEAIADTLRHRSWLDGRPLSDGGTGAPPAEYFDPFVNPWDGAASPIPSVAGLVRDPPVRGLIRVSLFAHDDTLGSHPLDGVTLPGSAPFALVVEPRQPVWMRVDMPQANTEQETTWTFHDPVLDLTERPAWGLVVELGENRLLGGR